MIKRGCPSTSPAHAPRIAGLQLDAFFTPQRLCQAFLWIVLFVSLPLVAFAQDELPWNRLYITNFSSQDVHVIDLNTEQTIAKIRVGSGPSAMAVAPNLDRVYVANVWAGTVSVIDTATNTVTNEISIPCDCAKSGPFGLALTQDGTKLYINNLNDGTIRTLDTATLTVTGKITGAYDWALRYIALSPDGDYVWAVGTGEGRVTVIRTADDQVVARINGLASARHLSFTPDGSRAYITGEKYSRLYVLDTKTFQLLKVFHFPQGYQTITADISKTGKFALVSNFQGKPTIIDTDPQSPTYHQVLMEIPPLSGYQYCIVVAPDNRFGYLTVQADRGKSPNSLNIIDLREDSPTRYTIFKTLPLGIEPWGIAVVKQTPNPVKAEKAADAGEPEKAPEIPQP